MEDPSAYELKQTPSYVSVIDMNKSSSWIKWLSHPRNAVIHLVCFPYSGGAAHIFRSWPKLFDPSIATIAIEFPGRGSRFLEPLVSKFDPMVKAISEDLLPLLNRPCIFFGHSMGAILAFEVIRYLRRMGKPAPAHLVVSGQVAPHTRKSERALHLLPDNELISALRDYNGTPEEVLENKEFMPVFLPILRADFAVIENYQYKPESPIDCPITAFGGTEDNHVSSSKLEAWQEQTTGSFKSRLFPGDHFFLRSQEDALLAEINAISVEMIENLGT
jgi:medium-chain acyl-[acyl-carrier-protein] hydrolase